MKHTLPAEICQEILAGLALPLKQIQPKYLYDEHGSQLFEKICRLPEYYPTRTETEILRRHRNSIATCLGHSCVLVEPGAGNCAKVRLFLGEWSQNNLEVAYVPMDISDTPLRSAAHELGQEFPDVSVLPRVADFTAAIKIPDEFSQLRPVLFYPGSTIGNFTPVQAQKFLQHIRYLVGAQGALLIGVDRYKDTALLHAAYNDSQNLTAQFNLNVLHHLNRILDGSVDVGSFEHLAFYNQPEHRIEMHLRCTRSHSALLGGTRVSFRAGETILTEYSYKYSELDFTKLLNRAGFTVKEHWTTPQESFSVFYCT